MKKNIENETPLTDSKIKLAISIGHIDNEVAFVFDSSDISALLSSWTGWYRHPRGGVYTICKDGDGYLVRKPGNGSDAWGSGYTWRDVKSGYGLAGVSWYQERRGSSCR